MTKVSTRRLPVAERRASILEAGGRLFGERGYDGTRLDDVAAAAGVTKPIVYRHFASKADLYLALLERHREDLETFAPQIPPSGPPEERLRAVFDVWLEYVEQHSYAWRMLFRDRGGGPRINEFRLAVHARARGVLVGIIRGFGEAEIPPGQLEPIAELMSMGMGSLVLWWLDHPEVPREDVLAALIRVWVGFLTA
jgi:AcrR family transcriptional regulator